MAADRRREPPAPATGRAPDASAAPWAGSPAPAAASGIQGPSKLFNRAKTLVRVVGLVAQVGRRHETMEPRGPLGDPGPAAARKIQYRERGRRKFDAHARNLIRIAGAGKRVREFAKAGIMADHQHGHDLFGRLAENIEEMIDRGGIDRIFSELRHMDGKGLEHALERLPGAARVGGDREFRRHALRHEKFADTAGVREAPPGERTFAVAAGGLLGGLAM